MPLLRDIDGLLQVLKDGYKPITTQIFDKGSDYLTNDSVFAVKDSLVVEFVPRKDDAKAKLELRYDIHMGGAASSKGGETASAPALINGNH